MLAAAGCGREGDLGWREPRERRNGGPKSWEPARGDRVPEVGPCLTGSVSGGPGEARGEGTPSEGPRESLSGHPHLGKISRARGWRCGSLYGETFLNRASSFNPPPLFPFALLELGSCRPCKRHCPPGGAGKEGREPGGRDTRLGSLHPLLPRHRGSPIWRGTGFSRARS